MKSLTLLTAVFLVSLLPGCATEGSSRYSNRCNPTVGAVVGGLAGGIVGSNIGAGRGRDLATVAGVAGGAYAGHEYCK